MKFLISLTGRYALTNADSRRHASVAFLIIGAGTGGLGGESALALMLDALSHIPTTAKVTLVRFHT